MKSKIIITLFLIFANSFNMFGQDWKRRYIICFTPSKANEIYGLGLGVWTSPDKDRQIINGINIELLGNGWITPFLGLDDGNFRNSRDLTINGLSVGLTLLNPEMNGITISPTINTTFYLNGLKLGLFNFNLHKANGLQIGLTNFNDEDNGVIIGCLNYGTRVKGLQIGLINTAYELHGLQIGLLNINNSRTTFLVNWSTRKKDTYKRRQLMQQ